VTDEIQASLLALESAVKGATARGFVPDAAWRAKERADRALLGYQINSQFYYFELKAALDDAIGIFSAHSLGIGVSSAVGVAPRCDGQDGQSYGPEDRLDALEPRRKHSDDSEGHRTGNQGGEAKQVHAFRGRRHGSSVARRRRS
jgi:hypothetical protein